MRLDDPGHHPADLWSTPEAATRLWTLKKHGRELAADLRSLGEYGYELQLLRDEDFYSARRFDERERAVAFAHHISLNLLADGWQPEA